MKEFKFLGIKDYSHIGDIFSIIGVMLCLWGARDGYWGTVIFGMFVLALIKFHQRIKKRIDRLKMKAEKEFVPVDIALKLKKLGFDEECFAYYPNGEETVDFILDGHDRVKTRKNSEFSMSCSAPLWQQVFRWFRSVHAYYGIIDGYEGSCEWKIASVHLKKTIRSKRIYQYEEAQMLCVHTMIELIETNK